MNWVGVLDDDSLDEGVSGLPEEDDLALFEAYRATQSTELHEKLVVRYSRLVVSLVRRFRGRASGRTALGPATPGPPQGRLAYNVSSEIDSLLMPVIASWGSCATIFAIAPRLCASHAGCRRFPAK